MTKEQREIHKRRMEAPLREADAREVLWRVIAKLDAMLYPQSRLRGAVDNFRLRAIQALRCAENSAGLDDANWACLVDSLLPGSCLRPQRDMPDEGFESLVCNCVGPQEVWWVQSSREWARGILTTVALADALEARGGDASELVEDLPRLKRWARILKERKALWERREKRDLSGGAAWLLQPYLLGAEPERKLFRLTDGKKFVEVRGKSRDAGRTRRRAKVALNELTQCIENLKKEWDAFSNDVETPEGKIPRPRKEDCGPKKKRGPREDLAGKALELIARGLHDECDLRWEPAEIAALFRAMKLPDDYDPGDDPGLLTNRGLLTKEEAERLNARLEQVSKPDGVKKLLWP